MVGFASVLLSAAFAAQAAFATPIRARSPYVVKETFNAPHGWTRLDRASKDHLVSLNIGLKQSNWDELERHLNEGGLHPTQCIPEEQH
jgi:tripeptidyl-peptidase-1